MLCLVFLLSSIPNQHLLASTFRWIHHNRKWWLFALVSHLCHLEPSEEERSKMWKGERQSQVTHPQRLTLTSICRTTSIPSVTSPKTTCFPSSQSVLSQVIKNWEPLVLGPELAMDSKPGETHGHCVHNHFYGKLLGTTPNQYLEWNSAKFGALLVPTAVGANSPCCKGKGWRRGSGSERL